MKRTLLLTTLLTTVAVLAGACAQDRYDTGPDLTGPQGYTGATGSAGARRPTGPAGEPGYATPGPQGAMGAGRSR